MMVPALRKAGQRKPDTCTDVCGSENVEGELEGPRMGSRDV